jgi:hypothetical protein
MSASGFHPTIELVAIIALGTDSFAGLDKAAHNFQTRFFLPLHAEVRTPAWLVLPACPAWERSGSSAT